MSLKEYLRGICKEKENVLKLDLEKLQKYKIDFYKKPFKKYELDLIWMYFWGDISLQEIKKIFRIGE